MNNKNRYFTYFLLCLVLYISAVTGYSVWSNRRARDVTIEEIDSKLLIAAQGLKYMLAPDFHDRAINENSILLEEEIKNRKAISSFAFETNFEWLYTLAEKDGKFFFSAPTVTDEEAKERASWYFLPYEDIPESFVNAFQNNKTVYITYSDQWGNFRSVAEPQTSPGGRRYLACADYKMSDIDEILRENAFRSVLTAVFFLIVSVPFVIIVFIELNAHNKELKNVNAELMAHKHNLEDLVQERTTALNSTNEKLLQEIDERREIQESLKIERDKLQRALDEVNQLSGLLPICSSCKKIRDDKGYWNQIEDYVSSRSEAQFSHGVCPDCVEKLYGGESWYKKRKDRQ